MYKVPFADGSFVMHKIRDDKLPHTRISAWYDKEGKLTDYERISDKTNTVTHIIRKDMVQTLELIGRLYA